MYYAGYRMNIFDIFYDVFSLLKLTCMTLNILNTKYYSNILNIFFCSFVFSENPSALRLVEHFILANANLETFISEGLNFS